MRASLSRGKIAAEFRTVSLGDQRLNKRLLEVVTALASDPSASIPSVMPDAAAREAAYRLLNNDKVSLEAVLSGHIEQTLARAAVVRTIRVVHDTTGLVFRGEREGMGPIKGAGQGFFLHAALAVADGEQREVLGVLGALTYANEKDSLRKHMTRSEQAMFARSLPREEKQSHRWESLAYGVHNALDAAIYAIHVMDQEGDDFTLLAELVHGGIPFVIRGAGNRTTELARASISSLMKREEAVLFRSVRVNPRPTYKARGKSRPARKEREAKLFIRWAEVDIARSDNASKQLPSGIPVTVVHVFEAEPPHGEEPIEWFLLTSETVETLEDAARVVDHYRARWVIEDYFKALKTGCAIEKRQLTGFEGLNNILGMLLPIAWRLLLLRQLARNPVPLPAASVMGTDQIKLLRRLLSKRRTGHRLVKAPTVRDIMLAVAALGGHIRNNGDPGWIVLGRGYQIFADAELIWADL